MKDFTSHNKDMLLQHFVDEAHHSGYSKIQQHQRLMETAMYKVIF